MAINGRARSRCAGTADAMSSSQSTLARSPTSTFGQPVGSLKGRRSFSRPYGLAASASEVELPPSTAGSSTTAMAMSGSSSNLVKARTLDHLGRPHKSISRIKLKNGLRTYSLLYDVGDEEVKHEDRVWKLLVETRTVLDLSIGGLQTLYDTFREVPSESRQFLDETSFSLALSRFGARHGAVDPIIVKRLFGEFSAPVEEDNPAGRKQLNFRELLMTFVQVCEDPVIARLELMLDVWDADDDGVFTYAEFAGHVTTGLSSNQRHYAIARFKVAWGRIKEFNIDLSTPSRNTVYKPITKEALIDTCRAMPEVRHFFEDMLSTCSATPQPMHDCMCTPSRAGRARVARVACVAHGSHVSRVSHVSRPRRVPVLTGACAGGLVYTRAPISQAPSNR